MTNPYGITPEDEQEFMAEAEKHTETFFGLTAVMVLAKQAHASGQFNEAQKMIAAFNAGIEALDAGQLRRVVAVAANTCAAKAIEDAIVKAAMDEAESFLHGEDL